MRGLHDIETGCCLVAGDARTVPATSNTSSSLVQMANGPPGSTDRYLQGVRASLEAVPLPSTLLALARLCPTCTSITLSVSHVPLPNTPTPGWSEASSAASLGFDTLPPPEAPALPPPRRSATGTSLSTPGASPAPGATPSRPAGTPAHTAPGHGGAAPGRALQRSASSRQGPRVVPQVVVTDDGRIAGDVDDLDLLDLDSGDEDEEAGQGLGLGEDGSVPSGVGLVGDQGGGSFRVVQHGDDEDDGDSVF